MNITKIIADLEAMPMEGGDSETDRAIQAFLDYLDTRRERMEQAA